jgi:hypothetical protein
MKNRWLLNLALVALIAGLAWVVLNKPGKSDTSKAPLTQLDPQSITEIRIDKPGQAPIRLAQCSGRWRLLEPLRARANRFTVESLARLASTPIETDLGPAGTNLQNYGLDKPLARVTLNEQELQFGAIHPFKQQQYVLAQGRVLLIPAHAFGGAVQGYGNFLETRLLEPDTKLTRIQVPGFTLTLRDGSWRRAPEDVALSGDKLNNFVAEWQHAAALSVEPAGKRPALGRATLAVGEGASATTIAFDVVARDPELVLRRPDEGLEYHFPAETGQRLLAIAKD